MLSSAHVFFSKGEDVREKSSEKEELGVKDKHDLRCFEFRNHHVNAVWVQMNDLVVRQQLRREITRTWC